MAENSHLDIALRQLGRAKKLWEIPKLLQTSFAMGATYDATLTMLNRLAEKVRVARKNGDGGPFSAFADKLRSITNADAKRDFLADEKNADIVQWLQSDPVGRDARRAAEVGLLYSTREQGAKVLYEKDASIREAFPEIVRLEEEIKKNKDKLTLYEEKEDEVRVKLIKKFLKKRSKEVADQLKRLKETLDSLEPWAEYRREQTQESIERLNKWIKDNAEYDAYQAIGKDPQKLRKKIDKLRSQMYAISHETIEKVRAILEEQSPVTPEQARDFVEKNVSFREDIVKKLGEDNVQIAKDSVAEIYRLCGGRLGPIKFFMAQDYQTRSHAVRGVGIAIANERVPDKNSRVYEGEQMLFRQTVWHEVGHYVEFSNANFGVAFETFVRDRATSIPMPLNAIAKSIGEFGGYEPNEEGYPDKFRDIYIGKYYEGQHTTEVCSMGVQGLEGAAYDICEEDYIEILTGVLTGAADKASWNEIESEMGDFEKNSGQPDTFYAPNLLFDDWVAAIDSAITDKFKERMLSGEKFVGISLTETDGGYRVTRNRGYGSSISSILCQSLEDALRRAYMAAVNELRDIKCGNPFGDEFPQAPDWFFPGFPMPQVGN